MGALTYQIRRRWRLPQLQASMSTGLHLQRIDHRLDPSRIEPRDRFVDHDRREMGRFRVNHGVLAIGVEQDFVETKEHAVDMQQPAAFGFDDLFKASGGAS